MNALPILWVIAFAISTVVVVLLSIGITDVHVSNVSVVIEAPTKVVRGDDGTRKLQIVSTEMHGTDDNHNTHTSLINKLLDNKLSTITCPKDGNDDPGVAEVRRTLWDPALQTSSGQRWKTELEQLVYIPINKNAHTRMVIAIDDVADKGILNNATKQFVKPEIEPDTADINIQGVLDSHELLRRSTSRAFTILRDPIDRYISGTCQDLMTRKKFRNCHKYDFGGSLDPLDWIGCIIQETADKGIFRHHQLRQVDQLASVLKGHPDLPISVLSVEQATDFMTELGVHNKDDKHIIRHRHSESYVQSGGRIFLQSDGTLPPGKIDLNQRAEQVMALCRLSASDLRQEQVARLCKGYAADVELLRSANMEVPLCD